MEHPQDVVFELTYRNYCANRQRSPQIPPERWAWIYGLHAARFEARYQQERRAEDDRRAD